MAYGPGKYDDLATYVREKAEAKGVLILVLDGNRGSGFSAQGVGHDPAPGIYPCQRRRTNRCWHCNLGGADHFCEEWDTYLHKRCIEPFLKTEEGLLVIRHKHLIQIGDRILQPEGENMLEQKQ